MLLPRETSGCGKSRPELRLAACRRLSSPWPVVGVAASIYLVQNGIDLSPEEEGSSALVTLPPS